MGRSIHNKTGLPYGSLIALRIVGKDRFGQILWECECECGQLRTCPAGWLSNGLATHCGCKTTANMLAGAGKRATHGLTRTPLYKAWFAMIDRCEKPRNSAYAGHGAIGVKVCREWRNSKEIFFQWALTHGYQEGLSLDRYPDPAGDYCPENCRWATAQQQQFNRRDNPRVEYNGEMKPLAELATQAGLKICTVKDRIERGWDIQTALTFLPNKTRHIMPRKRAS